MEIVKKYYEQLKEELKLFYDPDSIKLLEPFIKDTINSKFKDSETVITNNYRKEVEKIKMSKVFSEVFTDKNNALAVNGAFYDNSKVALSLKMLLSLKADRTIHKDQKFKLLEKANTFEQDSKDYKKYLTLSEGMDIFQLSDKLYMNSYYGVLGESNSLFYNEVNANAVTQTGQTITTTAVIAFETFFGNIEFDNLSQLSKYLVEILKEYETIDKEDLLGFENFKPDKKIIADRFVESTTILLEGEEDLIRSFIDDIEEDELLFILYFKNNFYEYIKLDSVVEILEQLSNGSDFLYIDKVISKIDKTEDLETLDDNVWNLETLWHYIDTIVAHYGFYFNRFTRSLSGTRKHILTIDKNFMLILNPFNCWKLLT